MRDLDVSVHRKLTKWPPLRSNLLDDVRELVGDKYRVDRELGGGGMARVFLGSDLVLQRPVVIKVLPPDRAGDLNAERFRREIQVIARLQHPNIVPVLAAGDGEGLLWFSMPFVAGESLRQRLSNHEPIAASEVLPILRDVARALAFAHNAGVVHRDIKPDNVLLSGGAAVVTDFGIAKAVFDAGTPDLGVALTLAGNSIGTPQYMSPEQISADPAIDQRADLYAFAIMAWEMLAGVPPFHDRSPQAILTAHLTEAPRPIAELAPATPPELAALVMHCLEKDASRRPPSAEALVARLEFVTTGGQREAITPATRLNWAKRWRSAAIATIVAAGLVTAVARWYSSSRPAAAVDNAIIAVAPFRVVSPDGSLNYLREGMLDILAAKLPGEGGIRVSEPRTMIAAWHRALQAEKGELSDDAARAVARSLGAGRLLLGQAVSERDRIEMTVRVVDVMDGDEVARAVAAGLALDVPTLADSIGASLLASLSPGSEGRTLSISRVPLEALRAFLDGVRLHRNFQSRVAGAALTRAIDIDSTFALAGLNLAMAVDWYGDPTARDRGLGIAWRHQDNLSDQDRLLLRAVAGPVFPDSPTPGALLAAREAYRAAAPDRAVAEYLIADLYFHEGFALGVPDPLRLARGGFERALVLDSLYVPGYAHALEIAAVIGDQTLHDHLARLRLAVDTAQEWRVLDRWLAGVAAGDSSASRAAWTIIEQGSGGLLFAMIDHATSYGIGVIDALRAADEIVRIATPTTVASSHRLAFNTFMIAGEPARAAAHLTSAAAADGAGVMNAKEQLMLCAVFGEGERAAAEGTARELSDAIERARPPKDSSAFLEQRRIVQTLAIWHLSLDDTSSVRRDLIRMRELSASPLAPRFPDQSLDAGVLAVDAWFSERTSTPDAGTRLLRLDSALANLPWSTVSQTRAVALGLLAGRLFERFDEPQRALTAVARRSTRRGAGFSSALLTMQLFEEARIAAAMGDVERARRTYEMFLALRPNPEPDHRARNDQARRALAALR